MTPTEATDGDLREEIAGLRAELAQMSDLFRRRLADDRDKRRAIDELASELDFARSGLTRQVLLPLFRQLLLVADRARNLDEEGAHSIGEELLAVLAVHGVDEVETSGSFDPSIHEASGGAADDTGEAGAVAVVERPGYRLGDALIRPARVTVVAGS